MLSLVLIGPMLLFSIVPMKSADAAITEGTHGFQMSILNQSDRFVEILMENDSTGELYTTLAEQGNEKGKYIVRTYDNERSELVCTSYVDGDMIKQFDHKANIIISLELPKAETQANVLATNWEAKK